jgi:hypothetical protein
MFIHVTRDMRVALEERHDLKHFKLVIDAPQDELARAKIVLFGIATIDESGNAWVSEHWLRQRDPAAPWQDGLTAMIAVAKKYGWVDDQAKTIRAHVEYPSQPKA